MGVDSAAEVELLLANPSPFKHMFYVYVLKSKKDQSHYIGFVVDLRSRIRKHNQGVVRSTENLRPLVLIYYEAYRSKTDALIREKQLKRFAKGVASLKGRLKNSLMLEG